MFAFLKKLFGKSPPALVPATASAAPLYEQPVATPRASAATPPAPRPPVPVPQSKPEPAKPAAPAPLVFSKETVDLPLKALWSKLDKEITGRALNSPDGAALLRLPLNLVQVHLAKGSMKIPLAQFRQFSPVGVFPDNSASDALEVVIPIHEILERLKPGQLPRRAAQKKIDVPEDIESVFGPNAGKNGKLRIVHEKLKPVVKPAAPAADEALAPAPETAIVASPEPILEPMPVAEAPAPMPPPEPVLDPEPIRAPKLDPGLATLRPITAPKERALALQFMDLAAHWAEKGRTDLEKLYRHSVEIPLGVIQSALKKGKVEFTWRELKPYVRLASGNALPDLKEETKIDFPLALVAPLFFEAQGHPAARKKIQIGDEIPDVFVKNVPAEPAVDDRLPAPEPALEKPESTETSGEYSEIFEQPDKKEWSLSEVSQRTSKLPGVAGAIIATSDGLLVGGSWPEGVGGEAVAAFVPQMYNRLSNYTNELKLGSPADFTLMVENVPLQIFKSADTYFTILGRAGENLPTRKLKAIATRLAANPANS